MNSKRILTCNNSYVSFLDLFVGGLTNLCTDLFCDTSVLSNLIDLRTKLPMWRNRSIPTQFRTSESTHSVMKMTMEWP